MFPGSETPGVTAHDGEDKAGIHLRLTDSLLESGIQPFCTLYHRGLPQVLQDHGGWQSRETAQAFADYAGLMASHLSDRLAGRSIPERHWGD
jgi:beta-glucosidase